MAGEVMLRAVQWSDEAERLLSRAIGNNPSYTIAELASEVENRTSLLMAVDEGPVRLGYVAVFVETFGGGTELVIQAGAALSGELNALKKAVPVLRQFARNAGATSMRAHLGDKARVRMFEGAGFGLAEYVVRAGV